MERQIDGDDGNVVMIRRCHCRRRHRNPIHQCADPRRPCRGRSPHHRNRSYPTNKKDVKNKTKEMKTRAIVEIKLSNHYRRILGAGLCLGLYAIVLERHRHNNALLFSLDFGSQRLFSD